MQNMLLHGCGDKFRTPFWQARMISSQGNYLSCVSTYLWEKKSPSSRFLFQFRTYSQSGSACKCMTYSIPVHPNTRPSLQSPPAAAGLWTFLSSVLSPSAEKLLCWADQRSWVAFSTCSLQNSPAKVDEINTEVRVKNDTMKVKLCPSIHVSRTARGNAF